MKMLVKLARKAANAWGDSMLTIIDSMEYLSIRDIKFQFLKPVDPGKERTKKGK